MTRSRFASVMIVAALTLGGPAGLSWAADSKDKLPKAKTDQPPAVVKPKEAPKPSAPSQGKDRFTDKDGDGVNDKNQARVKRSEDPLPPPTVKTGPATKAPAKPPVTKAPPGGR